MAAECTAGEIETRYATIIYDNDDLPREFNKGVRLRGLSYLTGNRSNLTITDEVKNKVDIISERVQLVLEMYVKTLKYKIVLLASSREVRRVYRAKYGKDVDFISFFSPGEKTIYLSTDDANLRIFAHEVAHAVIDQYFRVSPSVKIHEMLAKYAETHLDD
jgi:acyl transferase domain-containing protein